MVKIVVNPNTGGMTEAEAQANQGGVLRPAINVSGQLTPTETIVTGPTIPTLDPSNPNISYVDNPFLNLPLSPEELKRLAEYEQKKIRESQQAQKEIEILKAQLQALKDEEAEAKLDQTLEDVAETSEQNQNISNEKYHVENISGSEVQVMFEFPTNEVSQSAYVHMGTLITVSHSVARSKIPVYTLGDTTMSGMGLGTKMVAGSIVKLYTRQDPITNYIKSFVEKRSGLMKEDKLATAGSEVTTSTISLKEISEYMRDDLSPFNIHLISISESDNMKEVKWGVDTIFGASIINTGNVFSIENLVSEETMSFIAKEVRYQTDISFASSSNNTGDVTSVSELLGGG